MLDFHREHGFKRRRSLKWLQVHNEHDRQSRVAVNLDRVIGGRSESCGHFESHARPFEQGALADKSGRQTDAPDPHPLRRRKITTAPALVRPNVDRLSVIECQRIRSQPKLKRLCQLSIIRRQRVDCRCGAKRGQLSSGPRRPGLDPFGSCRDLNFVQFPIGRHGQTVLMPHRFHQQTSSGFPMTIAATLATLQGCCMRSRVAARLYASFLE